MSKPLTDTATERTRPKERTCGACDYFKSCLGKWFDDPECKARTRERELLMVLEVVRSRLHEIKISTSGNPRLTGIETLVFAAVTEINKAIQKAKGEKS